MACGPQTQPALPNSSSMAMMISTWSRLSRPRSFMKCEFTESCRHRTQPVSASASQDDAVAPVSHHPDVVPAGAVTDTTAGQSSVPACPRCAPVFMDLTVF